MAKSTLKPFKVVVIGGSAGSLEVVLTILEKLPAHPGVVFILVFHRKNDKDSLLENLLSHRTRLPVREVEDKEPILPNHIYIAPPDYHLLIEDEASFSLDSSEKIHFSRPSIDVTFESVAETFRDRVIGLLLSGANSDGAKGLLRIRELGGYTLVQNPEQAELGYMPQQAINLQAAMQMVDTEALSGVLAGLML